MNYEKIYSDFIADRLKNQPCDGYYEVHHIKPRCFGGSDDNSNLIRLTAEDHYFAHLLLARIHGGKLISAVFLMSKNHKKPVTQRAMYGFMRREWAQYAATLPGMKGTDNGNYCYDRYEWLNLDTYETRHATKAEMHSEFGGNRSTWTMVATGERNSIFGWCISTNKPNLRGLKGKEFLFINRDGREFTGTQNEFLSKFGVSPATASRIVRHQSVSKCGWRLSGVKDRKHCNKKSDGTSPRLGFGRTYIISKGSESYEVNRSDAAKIIGVDVQAFSAGVNFAMKRQHSKYKGWLIRDRDNKKRDH